MRTATTAAIPNIDAAAKANRLSFGARLGGLALAALMPAAFWSAVIGLIASWAGAPLKTTTIGILAGVIALFLFFVCAPIMLRVPARDSHDATRTSG